MTEEVVQFFNQHTATDLTPIFNQYLRHPAIPVLQLKFDEGKGSVSYRWKVDEPAFAMPVRVGKKDNWQIIRTPEFICRARRLPAVAGLGGTPGMLRLSRF
jgi:hypothetical protein